MSFFFAVSLFASNKKSRRPGRGGGSQAKGDSLVLVFRSAYQSIWARMPKPEISAPLLAPGPEISDWVTLNLSAV